MVFKSSLDELSNMPYKDKGSFTVHFEDQVTSGYIGSDSFISQTEVLPATRICLPETFIEDSEDNFCLDLSRKSIERNSEPLEEMLNSPNLEHRSTSPSYHCGNVYRMGDYRESISSTEEMDQPLDLSPAPSPGVKRPKSTELPTVVRTPSDNLLASTLIKASSGSDEEAGAKQFRVSLNCIRNNVTDFLQSSHQDGNVSDGNISPKTGTSSSGLSSIMSPGSDSYSLLPSSPSQASSSSLSPQTVQICGENLCKRYKYEPILPPCQVCGDNASGYHYGANTCEACKAFFRRALQRKTKFKCVTGGNCEVRQGRGFTCAYCRFQKCNQLGMSLTAIKRGRYTHAKKAENIREVKRLQQIKHDGPVQLTSYTVPKVQHQQQQQQDSTINQMDETRLNPQSKETNGFHRSPIHNNEDIVKALRCKEEELETLIKDVSHSHHKFFGDITEMRQRLPVIEAQFLERRMQREKLFGKLPLLPFSEYQQIWDETGIDVDGRQEILVEKLLPTVQKTITRIIQFARTLPDFCKLSCEDQVALIKGSRCENWFIGEHKCYNTREGLYTNSLRGETVDMNDMSKVAGSTEVVKAIFKIATRLQQCYLTEDEMALYKAVAIMQRDRAETEKGAAICESSQSKLMEALQYLVNKNHPEDPTLLARMLMILTDLRSVQRQKGEELAKMCMINTNQKFPPAVLQFLNLTPLE